MAKILIAGDSFSSEQLSDKFGWPILLRQNFDITNVSAPGIGEYKILQRIKEQNLEQYDLILVSHTSPFRVHSQENPLYPENHLYRHSDIIFTDAENKSGQIAKSVVDYYKYIFDPDYYTFVHNSCCKEIDELTNKFNVVHITHFEWTDLYQFADLINFHEYWKTNRGTYAHYTEAANKVVYKQLLDHIQYKLDGTSKINNQR